MLDDLGLVHMNGRIYDPLLGRMLSADTFVQDAGDLQAYNRYSYVRNNPTSLNDPSGHFWSAAITIGFAAYDTYNYATGKTTGAEYAKNMALNGAALVADVATAGQGGGLAVRAANAGIRVAKAVDKANDAYETVSTIVETGKVVASGDSGEISRAVVTNLVEHVVGGGKGKHDVDLNTNAIKTKKLDDVPKDAPTKGGTEPNKIGKEGQTATDQLYGPSNNETFEVNGRTRKPDHILAQDAKTKQPTIVEETKNVSYQHMSTQLKDDVSLVGPDGKVILTIPADGKVSKTVENHPQIEVRPDLPPKKKPGE